MSGGRRPQRHSLCTLSRAEWNERSDRVPSANPPDGRKLGRRTPSSRLSRSRSDDDCSTAILRRWVPGGVGVHGIDIEAESIFGGPPDLVLSGPNEGHNLGLVTPHSGTVGATVTALNLSIPAIAISANRSDLTAAEAALIAQISLQIVDAVNGPYGIRLPVGTGLNLNIPDVDPAKAAADYSFSLTRVGTASNIGLQFYEQLGDSPIANAFGIPPGFPFPGVSVEIPYT